jgi:diguanylate cyclase (GGDEF)-like protein
MVWIGLLDRKARKIVPIASSGADEEYLAALQEIFSSTESVSFQNTMTAQAIREKKAVVSNDSQSDPKVMLAEKHREAGIRSIAILPLMVADEVAGVMVLYADAKDFFHQDEMKLLTELAGDISFAMDHLEKQDRLNYLAFYDDLTGLANRSLFLERVSQYMRSAAHTGHKLALFLIDLERFKYVNDSLGRSTGDTLLRQVAEWLTLHMEDKNLVTRLNADRFAVVLPTIRQEDDVIRFLDKAMTALQHHPFRLNDAEFRINAKAGIALFPDDSVSSETLLGNAEAALKKAKAIGDAGKSVAQGNRQP